MFSRNLQKTKSPSDRIGNWKALQKFIVNWICIPLDMVWPESLVDMTFRISFAWRLATTCGSRLHVASSHSKSVANLINFREICHLNENLCSHSFHFAVSLLCCFFVCTMIPSQYINSINSLSVFPSILLLHTIIIMMISRSKDDGKIVKKWEVKLVGDGIDRT